MKKQIYTIPFDEAQREYFNNETFRETLHNGCFIYAESSFVLNSDKYIVRDDTEYALTDYARSHLDECALPFDEIEIIKYSGSATRGAEGQDAAIEIRRSTTFASHRQAKVMLDDIKRIRKAAIEQFEIQAAHQKTCWQRIYEIVTGKGTKSAGMFKLKTDLSDRVYNRAKNNYNSMPDIKTIVTIAAAYDLDLSTTEELLKLAGHSFSTVSKEHDCYRFIIMFMYGRSMNEKNSLLADEGFDPLGTKPQGK